MDKLLDDSDCLMARYNCSCLDPYHSLDIIIEKDKEGRLIECCIYFNILGSAPLKWRLKAIWKLLRGKDSEINEFYLREEDIPELIGFLKNALPGKIKDIS